MKSALEIAMEKSNKMEGRSRKGLNDEQKKKIAERRSIAKAKVAEAEIMMNSRIAKVLGEPESVQLLREGFAQEKEKIEAKAEKDVEKIREEG